MDLTTKNTATEAGGWVGTVNDVAQTINDFLTMKNNLAEKKQKRDMTELQMQQMRMQLQGQQRQMQEQDELSQRLGSISKTKIINLPEEEVRYAYTPEAWEAMPNEEKNKLLQQEVPKTSIEMLQEAVPIQYEHGIKTGKINLQGTAALLKQLQSEQNPKAEKAPAALQEFEIATGMDPSKRGTPEYQKALMKYTGDKATAQGMKYPQYQQVPDMPGWGFNRLRNTIDLIGVGGKTVATIGVDEANKMTPDRIAEIKAATVAYKNIEKQYAMVGQAELQAERNIKILRQYSDKYIRIKYPTPNSLLAVWDVQTGDVPVEQFKIALLAASREYMRVVTGGARSAAELSVDAQKKADELLNVSKSWDVLQGQTDVMMQELKATKGSYDEQMQELKDKIKGVKKPTKTEEPPKKKKSPIAKQAWIGRAMAANPGMTKAQVEAEFDSRYTE
jgi:hypothetical protein